MRILIDRDALLVVPHVRKVVEYDESGEFITFNAVSVEDIEKASATDAVPIVRCGECIHRRKPLYPHPSLVWCPLIEHHRMPDWFCADGRRMKE